MKGEDGLAHDDSVAFILYPGGSLSQNVIFCDKYLRILIKIMIGSKLC